MKHLTYTCAVDLLSHRSFVLTAWSQAGFYDIGIAGGVENMSANDMSNYGGLHIDEQAMEHKLAKGCYMTMGQTSEEVAARFGISRRQQDEFAAQSHARAGAAIAAGRFKAEIVPVTVKVKDPKTGEVHKTSTQIANSLVLVLSFVVFVVGAHRDRGH